MQPRIGAEQNLAIEGTVGLLAGLGAELQIAVNALAEGALQLRGRSSFKMKAIPKPCDRAGKRLVLRIKINGSSGITFVFHTFRDGARRVITLMKVVGRVSPPRVVLLYVGLIDGLSILVGDKGQSSVREGRVH